MIMEKVDSVIWARHCDPELQAIIYNMVQGQTLGLLVNGTPTVWVKMNDGADGRPTYGIRIEEGGPVWRNIAMGEEFDISLIEITGFESASEKWLAHAVQCGVETERPRSMADTGNSLHNGTTLWMEKRDQYCIWASHCDQNLESVIRELAPRQPLELLINGIPTVWVKMNDGRDGRPTYGIKIVNDDESAWASISLHEFCEVSLLRPQT